MTIVRLTRTAIQELRHLRSRMSNDLIPEILEKLRSGESSNLLSVRNAKQVERYKRRTGSGAYLRLFLDQASWPAQTLVIGAGVRQGESLGDAYNRDFNNLPRNPCYSWHGQKGEEWDEFINGGYNESAVISEEQQEAAQEAEPSHHLPQQQREIGFHSIITQSPPGTGKTITAAERAYQLWKNDYNVIFLLPEILIEQQVKRYHCIAQILEKGSPHFFIGTFHQWVKHRVTEGINIMSPEEQLSCLKSLAERKYHWSKSRYSAITNRDVSLYLLFVVNDNTSEKYTLYQDNKNRIKELRKIDKSWWKEEIGTARHCRLGVVERLSNLLSVEVPNHETHTNGTIFIIDEAQDYWLEEIQQIKTVCQVWQSQGHPTCLWLLGDLNQRISPVDFDWGALQLNKIQDVIWPNYRTTEVILTFANQFQNRANDLVKCGGGRWLPEPTNPSQCFERPGAPIKVLIYPDLKTAEGFLQPLVNQVVDQMSDWQEKHSLQWRLAARARLFCSDDYYDSVIDSDFQKSLEFMPVSQAKGREFDACVAFCIFDLPKGNGQVEAYTKWYTQLTRARSRLLVVTTEEQRDRIGQDIFDETKIRREPEMKSSILEFIDIENKEAVDDALIWITEFTNELQYTETEAKGIKEIILSGLEQYPPLIYWDMFDVLKRYFSDQAIAEIEQEIVNKLYGRSSKADYLSSYLSKDEIRRKFRLRTLLLRCLGRSWEAAKLMEDEKPEDYRTVIESIVKDLQDRNLPLEADRIKTLFLQNKTPMPTNLSPLFTTDKKLIPALAGWIENRLA